MSFAEKKEYDQYDQENKCKYFIAVLDGKMVGTARLVVDKHLPVEKDYFEFSEPLEMKKIPRNKRVEVSRLISRPHKFVFPRHFIILGLFDVIIQFSFEHDIRAGYAVIERPFQQKLEKLKFPFRSINNFQIKHSPLTKKFPGYFTNKNNLSLIYFFRDEVHQYIKKIINNRIFFQKLDQKTLIFKTGACYKFLKLIRKIQNKR
jgi:hypothetical protein